MIVEIQVFENEEFGSIRTVCGDDNRPVFCAKDVATALGYKDAVNAIKQHCRGVAIYHPIKDSLGREQDARFITEGDMYRLIASSKLEGAQRESAPFSLTGTTPPPSGLPRTPSPRTRPG